MFQLCHLNRSEIFHLCHLDHRERSPDGAMMFRRFLPAVEMTIWQSSCMMRIEAFRDCRVALKKTWAPRNDITIIFLCAFAPQREPVKTK